MEVLEIFLYEPFVKIDLYTEPASYARKRKGYTSLRS